MIEERGMERYVIIDYIKTLTKKTKTDNRFDEYLKQMEYIREHGLSLYVANRVMNKAKLICWQDNDKRI